MLPLSLTEANLRAAFWRAIEGISADQICTTSRDDTAFSMNLRKSDSRDRESRFEREMESKARHKGAKAEASLKQAAIPDKNGRPAEALWRDTGDKLGEHIQCAWLDRHRARQIATEIWNPSSRHRWRIDRRDLFRCLAVKCPKRQPRKGTLKLCLK